MPDTTVITALAKVMIAAAWADGEIDHEEVNSIKDLLFYMPNMTAADYTQVEIYLATPIGEAERARLVAELSGVVRTDADKALVMNSLTALAQSDGEVGESEAAVLAEVQRAFDEGRSASGQLGRLLRGAAGRRSQTLRDAPNRENYLDDFVRNRVYYLVRERMGREAIQLDLADAELRRLSLAGALAAQVAHVGDGIDEKEKDAIARTIGTYWSLRPEHAMLVAEVAASEASRGLDNFRVARELFEVTTEEERLRLIDGLFGVARSHSKVSYEQIENIRNVAALLKLSHDQFIDAKLKVPREERDGL
ncbi:MAG TPA: TerB family tellurite resistance protein [Anaerolineae bacterium]|nr:TerB family tellurite resistance protein [Anaerolineae bacterium]